MKNNHLIVSLGIAIPFIAVMVMIILIQNNKNLVSTDYNLLMVTSKYPQQGECLHEKFSIDTNKNLIKTVDNLCLNRKNIVVNELVVSDQLYLLDTKTEKYEEVNLEDLKDSKIYANFESPDGVSYGNSSRYRSNDIQELLTLGLSRSNERSWTINLEKGVWSRKIEIKPTSNNYYDNPGILGWVKR
ncbi:MAG: hypothetical protein RJA61_483 [Candidatus Parcubacteria bacterium]|jgi:hypothetical protein